VERTNGFISFHFILEKSGTFFPSHTVVPPIQQSITEKGHVAMDVSTVTSHTHPDQGAQSMEPTPSSGIAHGWQIVRLGLVLWLLSLLFVPAVAFASPLPAVADLPADAAVVSQQDPLGDLVAGALDAVEQLRILVWIACAGGLCGFLILWAGQAVWPQAYGQVRGFMRDGIIFIIVFLFAYEWLISQAK
jgi:hypothetical protein